MAFPYESRTHQIADTLVGAFRLLFRFGTAQTWQCARCQSRTDYLTRKQFDHLSRKEDMTCSRFGFARRPCGGVLVPAEVRR